MKITLFCSDDDHPVNSYLDSWVNSQPGDHRIDIVRETNELTDGDFLFLVSCAEIVPESYLKKYTHALVLHASDLPRGRGWSPHVWEIIGGAEELTLSLLEASANVDSGRIWLKKKIPVPAGALWNEVNHLLFSAEIELMTTAVNAYGQIEPRAQSENIEPTYYRRRRPPDSQVDVNLSIREQFNLIRMCDPRRYPAFIEIHGSRYRLILEKLDHD